LNRHVIFSEMALTIGDAGRDVQALSCEDEITLALAVAMKRAPKDDVNLLRRLGEWVWRVDRVQPLNPVYMPMRQCSECLVDSLWVYAGYISELRFRAEHRGGDFQHCCREWGPHRPGPAE
jgi:hypothetical protein